MILTATLGVVAKTEIPSGVINLLVFTSSFEEVSQASMLVG
jgi:hypothetical protein